MISNIEDSLSQNHLFELYEQMFGEVGTINVLQKAADLISDALNAERATIYIVLKETEKLKSVAVIGNVSQSIIIPINKESLAGFCALSKRSFLVSDAYGDLTYLDPNIKFDRSWDILNNFRTRDVVCAPVVFKGEVLGVIQAINSKRGTFNESLFNKLVNINRFIGYALYHAQLYDELADLKGLEKEKAEFLRLLVHELRSPIAISKMLISTMIFKSCDNSDVTTDLNRIESWMDHLLSLVEDILNMSKIKSGYPLGEIGIYDLVSETKSAFDKYLIEGKSKGLAMNIKLPKSSVSIRIDIQAYKLILSNLLSNALKFTMEGSVLVSIEKCGRWAVLKVKDTGIGIPRDEIPTLFKEFFRASNARKNKIKGSGIGLAGVKELLVRFGGMIELDSQENIGSEFTIYLPFSNR